jgi:hypothetical protein
MHPSNNAHISIDNNNFVKNFDSDYKYIIGIRKERRTKLHSNYLNLKETLVLLFTIFSIVLPIGIQPESQADIVFAQSDIRSINDDSENDKSEISSSSSFSESTSKSNSNKDPLGSTANSGKDSPDTKIFDPSIDLPSYSAAESNAVTQADNSNEKIVPINESTNDWNSHESIQSSHEAYDDSVDSSTEDKVNDNMILHDDNPVSELLSTGSEIDPVTSAVNDNTNGTVNNEFIVPENQSTVQSDFATDSQSYGSVQYNNSNSKISSEPISYGDHIDNSKNHNSVETDDKPGTGLSSAESLTGTVNNNINPNLSQDANQSSSILENRAPTQLDSTTSSQFQVDKQSSNSNYTVSSQPLYKSYRDFIEHNKANNDDYNENGIFTKSTAEPISASAEGSQVTAQSSGNAYGDFNGDGRDDLAIGVPGEGVRNPDDMAGAVNVLYGSSSGLSATSPRPDQFWTQDSTDVNEDSQVDDNFGSSLASGDFNGDGKDDLAIGVPGEGVNSQPSAGGLEVLYGSSSGLSATSPRPDQFWTQDSTEVDDIVEQGDNFGSSLSSGDFNGDGKDDLAIGVPNENGAGAVSVLYGSSSGLSATSPRADQFWTQDSPDVDGASETSDSFGHSLTSGDFNNDGRDDLAIGVPDEGLGAGLTNSVGGVEVIYGSSSGLSATSPRTDQFWTQDSANIDDVAENNNAFGFSLASGDFNDDGKDDLAIGIRWEQISSNSEEGAVEVIYGSSSGLSATSPRADQFWTQDSANINDASESEDQFGYSLSSGDYNGDGKDDLAIGVFWEDVDIGGGIEVDDAGGVEVIYGSSSGLSATSPRADQFWTQDSADINDVPERPDEFGSAVYSGDFNGDGKDDLAIGVPQEDVGSIESAGGVEIIYGSSSGLSATATRSDQFWTQSTADVDDASEFADHYGTAVG